MKRHCICDRLQENRAQRGTLQNVYLWRVGCQKLVNEQQLLASERSERDTYRCNTIENRGCLFICIYVRRTYVILYFDPRVFVLVMWSTPSQIALNRILWFINQYPYHPRN